jgi:hypothetical protein
VRRAAVRLLPRLLNVDDQVWRVVHAVYSPCCMQKGKPTQQNPSTPIFVHCNPCSRSSVAVSVGPA